MAAMTKSPLVIFLGLVVGALLGGWAGRAARPVVVPVAAVAPTAITQAKADEALPKATRPEADGVLLARWEFAQQVQKSDEAQLSLMLERARAATDPLERSERMQLVALRYAALNPQASAEKYLSGELDFSLAILKGWGAKDGLAAVQWAMDLKGLQERTVAMEAILPTLAVANPEGLAALAAQPEHRVLETPEVAQEIFSAWAMRDPAGAIAKLPTLKNPRMRERGHAAVARTWAKRDVQAAMAWAKSLPPGRDRANALQGAVNVLGESDPHAAIEALNLIDPKAVFGEEPPHAAIAASLARLDVAEAAKWVKGLDAKVHDVESILAESVFNALPEVTATSLVTLFQGVDVAKQNSDFSNTVEAGRGLQGLLLQWRPADFGAALQEAVALPSCEARQSVINYLTWRLAKEQPEQVLAAAAGATPAVQEKLALHLAHQFAERGDLEGLGKAGKLMTEPTRQLELTREAGMLLATHHPEQAAAFLEQLPAEAQPAAAAKMIPSLVAWNPQEALALSEKLPEEARPLHAALVVGEWAKSDAAAAVRWAQEQPAGPIRDAAASGAVSTLYNKEPQTAYPLARGISDRETRVNQLQAVYHEWLFLDAGAAQAAMASAGLPADELAAALKPPPDNHPNPAALDRDLMSEDAPAEEETPPPAPSR